ncbi:XRE family transcriptional regulator [Pseudomonas sp. 10C3]|uniref:XRE family transcriptional regulator n=1 Tax=Pseudomonas sp. 10C3 TaxID=3118753 RepID=UPI002E8220FD|nr:XRE family transcriptional regulator [Pseudomonas sp. 10C3]MEE3508292.1 XRE family transcriptional regulator [Pseudomonas sp. 10C3]
MALSSLFRGMLMSLSKGLAAALKAARSVRALSQQDLGNAGDRKHLWLMENAKSSPTLNKFDELSRALKLDPVTLLALCVAARDRISPADALVRAQREIDEFEQLGGIEKLLRNFEGDGQSSRAEERAHKLAAVQECKRQGLSQKATIEKLGIPRSTVNDLWKKS